MTISFIQPLPSGNAVKLLIVPPALVRKWRVLRSVAPITGIGDAQAITVYEGNSRAVLDIQGLQNGQLYYYAVYNWLSGAWQLDSSSAATPLAAFSGVAPDALLLVRDRLEAALAVMVVNAELYHKQGRIPVLTAPPLTEDAQWPCITVHLQSEQTTERGIGDELMIDFFNEDVFLHAVTQGYSDETPVFIVGMPRSGTSLVEQIISSHGQVVGIGEREYLAQILFKKVKHSDDAKLFSEQMLNYALNNSMEIGTEYIKEIRSHSDAAKLIINKLPHNFLFIGVIKMALPRAKIIHCVRDPRDTCLSCYKTLFRGVHEYTYDLTELGRYYRLYQRVMERWHHLLPGYILDVQYEHLVNDPEKNIRRMLDFCDLSWDDSCLAPEQNRRNVYTASSVQVRRPIYKSSVHTWRKFAKQLEPLIQQLGET